ncbi:deoxyguanosinetriphosphate triphosphohydrolase-like protein [Planctomycetales bacterium]|nr:deoxyguanosinetriphosphate triphosphohydrolase-like protein [Planctomycetales bacterium]
MNTIFEPNTNGEVLSVAFRNEETEGRRFPEPAHPYRLPFQRDRDRIIHCAAFRRLGEKMQVFTANFGNYHRNRMTHTLEVAGIARTISRALYLNEDLTETAALLHDIGHPPFGHTGEAALNELLSEHKVSDNKAFNHNEQALRIVEKLEHRYPDFTGLNLSQELLDGQRFKVMKDKTPLLEIQATDAADSIAYDTHDADDAMEIGLLQTEELFQTALWKHSAGQVRERWTNLTDAEFRSAVIHGLIETQVSDLIRTSQQNIRNSGIKTAKEALLVPFLIEPSADIKEQKSEMETFLKKNVYQHPKVEQPREKVSRWIRSIFEYYTAHFDELPVRYDTVLKNEGVKRAAADYIADMTDSTAHAEALRIS